MTGEKNGARCFAKGCGLRSMKGFVVGMCEAEAEVPRERRSLIKHLPECPKSMAKLDGVLVTAETKEEAGRA